MNHLSMCETIQPPSLSTEVTEKCRNGIVDSSENRGFMPSSSNAYPDLSFSFAFSCASK